MQGRDDDDGDGIADSHFPVGHRLATGSRGRQPFRPLLRDIGANNKTRAAQRLGALLANQAATDNRHTYLRTTCLRRAHFTAHRSTHFLLRSRDR